MEKNYWGERVVRTEKGIHDYLSEFARESPDKRMFFTEKREYTAGEIYRMTVNMAHRLREMGVKKGELIGLRATRSIQTGVLFYALEFLGAVAVLTDPHNDFREFIGQSGVEISVEKYLSNEEEKGGIAAEDGWRFYDGERKTGLSFETTESEDAFSKVADIHAPAVLIFTSGSTGRNKAVVLSQYNCMNHAVNYGYGGCYKATDVSICLVPMHHVYGLALWLTIIMHHYEIMFPDFLSVDYIAKCIDRYRLTRLGGVPSLMYALAQGKREKGYRLNSLQAGTMGGAPITAEQFAFIESTLEIRLMPVYGMSECIGISGSPERERAEVRRMTVGKPLPLNEVTVQNEEGEEVGIGETGEICVRSPVVMLGYYGDEESTKAVLKGGWLHTGDLGYIDEEGYLHISGRKKDIIIRNGNNISSAKIEAELLKLKYVENAAVVSGRDEKAGEVPCALVVLKAGEARTEAEIINDLQGSLTKIELPARIKFAEELPLTTTGKTDKERIRKVFAK